MYVYLDASQWVQIRVTYFAQLFFMKNCNLNYCSLSEYEFRDIFIFSLSGREGVVEGP